MNLGSQALTPSASSSPAVLGSGLCVHQVWTVKVLMGAVLLPCHLTVFIVEIRSVIWCLLLILSFFFNDLLMKLPIFYLFIWDGVSCGLELL